MCESWLAPQESLRGHDCYRMIGLGLPPTPAFRRGGRRGDRPYFLFPISCLLLIIALPLSPALPQDRLYTDLSGPLPIRVERIAIGTEIVDREPQGVADAFPDTVGTLYCFTQVAGAFDTTTVTHLWYHNDNLRAEVTLRVIGSRWRTWSSKRIFPGWIGSWRVEVISPDALVLKVKRFRIETTATLDAGP